MSMRRSMEINKRKNRNIKTIKRGICFILVGLMLVGCRVMGPSDPGVTTPPIQTMPIPNPSGYLPNQGITVFVWKNKDGDYVGNYLEGIESKITFDQRDKELYSESQEQMKSTLESQTDDMLFYFRGIEQLSKEEQLELKKLMNPVGTSKKLYQDSYNKEEFEAELMGVDTVWSVVSWKNKDKQWMFWSFYGLDFSFTKIQLESVPIIAFTSSQLVEIINDYGNVNVNVRGLDQALTQMESDLLSEILKDVNSELVFEGQAIN